MYIKFGWGRNLSKDDLKYTATEFNVSLSSSEEYGIGLGNCLPGQININLEVEPSYQHKPATDILKFAKNQHDIAKTEGAGKIVVYPEATHVFYDARRPSFEPEAQRTRGSACSASFRANSPAKKIKFVGFAPRFA